MANISLNQFITNVKKLKDNPIEVFSEQIIEMTHAVLWQIAKHTIIDDGQARASVIRKFADKYGMDIKGLEEEFSRYWESHGYPENASRSWDNYDTTQISDSSQKIKRKININISDEGFYYQEVGGRPSPHVKFPNGRSRDNSNFLRRPATQMIDKINNEDYGSFERLDYDKLARDIVKNVEIFLFKK